MHPDEASYIRRKIAAWKTQRGGGITDAQAEQELARGGLYGNDSVWREGFTNYTPEQLAIYVNAAEFLKVEAAKDKFTFTNIEGHQQAGFTSTAEQFNNTKYLASVALSNPQTRHLYEKSVAIGFNEMSASDKALFTAKGVKGFGVGLPKGIDEQLQAYAALVDKQTYARMVAAAKAIAANPSEALSGMAASLKGETKDALLGVYLSWMQSDSQALGELSGKIVGAAIVDTVAAATGVAVVKNSAQIAEGLAKIGGKVSVLTGKELERIAKNALVNSGGVASWKTGQPLLDMSLLSPTQKGMMGELFGPNTVKQIIPDGLKIGRTPGVGQTGIDDLYKVNRTGVDYVVVEYKFNTSSLGSTADGAQMSDSWLRGDATKYQRILESVQGDVASATAIRSSMDAGRVEKWVVRTMPDGSTKITVLDAVGQVKNVDTSKILIPKNNPYGVKYE